MNDVDVFQKHQAIINAMAEFEKHKSVLKKDDVITVINMRASSVLERLYVVNLANKEVILSTHAAHGVGSAAANKAYADKFSNTPESHKSSLGAMMTGGTYSGKHGLSLKLEGLEEQNSNVLSRNIVIHQADYMSSEFIRENGRAGCSFGCPAVPNKDRNRLIDLIKNGSFLYIYY